MSQVQAQIQDKPYSFKDREWPKADKLFKLGERRPPDALSVKGQIYDLVAQHPEGITGDRLAVLAQGRVRTPRSHHASNGEPELEWVQRYIAGMTREKFKFLKISEEDSTSEEAE